MKSLKLALAGVFLLGASCLAGPLSGTVYGVYPEGVMVDHGRGAYLIPHQHATFSIGNIRATWSSLQPGQMVNVVVPDNYWRHVTPVADPYRWKLKHHPRHPHGGPPGQMKKYYNGHPGKGKGKWK